MTGRVIYSRSHREIAAVRVYYNDYKGRTSPSLWPKLPLQE